MILYTISLNFNNAFYCNDDDDDGGEDLGNGDEHEDGRS